MTARLAGKVAVVTGGASGMGLAMARRFLDEGARVVIADLNERSGAEALAQLDSDDVRFVPVDVAAEADVERMVATAVGEFGRLDVLCNNAGVGGAFGSVTDIELEDFEYTFSVNVAGVFLGIKHGARQMITQGGGGSIINTGSIAARSGSGGPPVYSATKAAVHHLAQVWSVELAAHRIRVNTIAPGVISTPLMHGGRPDEAAARIEPHIPWGEVGQPEHIADVALFYASDESAYVTGDVTVVDGGLLAATPGVAIRSALPGAPPGFVGVNRGTTGEGHLVRRRPEDGAS